VVRKTNSGWRRLTAGPRDFGTETLDFDGVRKVASEMSRDRLDSDELSVAIVGSRLLESLPHLVAAAHYAAVRVRQRDVLSLGIHLLVRIGISPDDCEQRSAVLLRDTIKIRLCHGHSAPFLIERSP
jgi:hypothetical protein